MECKLSDLVKRGHDQAAELKASCGAVDVRDVAQLISDLASQLDVQRVRVEESQREFRAADATIENLQMQVEKLAAENGQMLRLLTDISENHDEYVNQDEYLYAGVPMDYVSEINAYVSRDVEAENPFKATDAFLAEVRAQGVDMFALMFAEEAIKTNNITTGWRAKASRAASEYAEALRENAAQLRKGVQS